MDQAGSAVTVSMSYEYMYPTGVPLYLYVLHVDTATAEWDCLVRTQRRVTVRESECSVLAAACCWATRHPPEALMMAA